jgi:16S rRNA (adenine1518-N6/adenine1519-N6)-dimethyltransferase
VGLPVDLPPLDIPGILKEFGIRPDKSLGQNFLIDTNALKRVVEIASLSGAEEILEVGAGLGSLTRMLADHARRVVAVEVDRSLIPPLRRVLELYNNVEIVSGDILDYDPAELISTAGYLVVANIPYYITSAIIRHLMESKIRPSRLVLTVQREVAERICAAPGKISLLSLSVQVYGDPVVAGRIPAGSFYPPPQVDSAIVRIDLRAEPRIPETDLLTFFQLARTAFAQKRKKLRNSLASLADLDSSQVESMLEMAGINPDRRPETLSLEEWHSIVGIYRENHPPRHPSTPTKK